MKEEKIIIEPRNEKYVKEGIPRKLVPYMLIDEVDEFNFNKHYCFKIPLN